ncbi:MAG: diacylglycerol kinase family lipid kinase [Planctomycetaceae bacterium]
MAASELHHDLRTDRESTDGNAARWQVIWNAHSGSAAENEHVLLSLANRRGVVVSQSKSADDAQRLAQAAALSGANMIVAAGGDGTVNSVAQGILQAKTETPLAILPLGTGNDFCRNMGIPIDPEQALQLLNHPRRRKVDVIRAETKTRTAHYINMATGGNTARYSDAVTEETKQFWGPLAYLRGAVELLTALDTFHVRIAFEDEAPLEADVLNLFLANGKLSGGGLMVAPDAEMDDGLLDVIVVRDCSASDIATLAAQYALTDYRQHASITYRQTRKVTLSASPPLAITTDGDLLTDEPATLHVLPRALNVVVPEQ